MTNIKKLTKEIKISNAKFEKLEKRDQRVAIARDVIAALKSEKLVAQNGTYMKNLDWNKMSEKPNQSFQVFLKTAPTCNVCAKGAIFTCTVARKNNVTNSEVSRLTMHKSHEMSEMLGGLFSEEQLMSIEDEFECDKIDVSNYGRNPPVMNLLDRFDNAEDRMICIMNNIIRNRGTFRPDKEVWKD